MKVKQLIEILESMNQDAEINIKTWSSDFKKEIEVKSNLNDKVIIYGE